MNENQRVLLTLTMIIAILMFIFPPFHLIFEDGRQLGVGYGFIAKGPEYAKVNVALLLTQWVGLSISSGLLFLLLKTDTTTTIESNRRSGWPAFYAICMIIFLPLLILGSYNYEWTVIESISKEIGGMDSDTKTSQFLDGSLSLILAMGSIWTGIKLWKLESGAISLTKNFLGFIIAAQILSPSFMLRDTYEVATKINNSHILMAFIWSGVWYYYFTFSPRIKALLIENPNANSQNDQPIS